MVARQAPPAIPRHTDSPGPALVLSDRDDDVHLLNDFGGEENDESIEAIQEAIDQMGVEQPDNAFEMVTQAGSEYAYRLAGTAEEKKRAEALIQQVHIINLLFTTPQSPYPTFLFSPTSTDGHGKQAQGWPFHVYGHSRTLSCS